MVEFFIIAKGYSFELFEHIGIGYIKSYLKRNGVDSNINLILPNEKEELYNILENKKPLVVGFVVYSFNALEIKEASRIVKMCLPNTHITVGGPATLNCTKEILDMLPDVDSVIEGEGEYTFLELVNLIKQEKELSGCQGLTFRKGKEIVINSSRPLINNLDSLPFPARDIFEKYPSSYIRIIGSRGCSGHCTFCVYGGAAAKGIQKGERVRFRSAVNIVDEMEELVEKYGVRSFYFIDDTFIEEKYVKGIEKVEGIIEEVTRRKLDITFAIQTRPQSIARNEKVREYIKRLQKIGLNYVFIGLDTGNNDDMRIYGKNTTIQDNIRAVQFLQEQNVHLSFGFIMFNPYSSIEKILQNANFLYENHLGYSIYSYLTQLEVYPTSTFRSMLIKDGLMDKNAKFSDILAYKFLDKRIEKLTHLFRNLSEDFEANHLMENIGILKTKIINHQKNGNENLCEKELKEINDIYEYYNQVNYQLFCNCIKLISSDNVSAIEFLLKQYKETYTVKMEKLKVIYKRAYVKYLRLEHSIKGNFNGKNV